MKTVVLMSGGVDSSVSALLLKQQGHDVIGITAVLTVPDVSTPAGDLPHVRDAAAICSLLGIDHHVYDLRAEFKSLVIDPFCNEYLSGKTPSPCIGCNRMIKFGMLMDTAMSFGCERVATGHYANIASENNRFFIKKHPDQSRDQSYFLFALTQEQLSRIMFPLSNLKKTEVREIAEKNGLITAQKKDSQEICFIPGDNYKEFIETRFPESSKEGPIMLVGGGEIGRHSGIHRYTIGQRRGLGIGGGEPLYVVEIDHKTNTVFAGHKKDLLKKGLVAEKINRQKAERLDLDDVFVKTRSAQPPCGASAREKDGLLEITFHDTVTGISPGQAAVIYDHEGCVLGGGWITKSF